MENDNDRIFKGYILKDDPTLTYFSPHPCSLCGLEKLCDNMADTLNDIEYCICLKCIKDVNYKKEHPNSYFIKIE